MTNIYFVKDRTIYHGDPEDAENAVSFTTHEMPAEAQTLAAHLNHAAQEATDGE